VNAARQAAAAILSVDASLDVEALAALAQGRTPLLRAAVASALRASGDEDEVRRFLLYAARLRLAPEELVRFAEDCDAYWSSADPVLVGEDLPLRWRARLGARAAGLTRALGPLLFGPALAGSLAAVGANVDGRTPFFGPPTVRVGWM